MGVAESEAWITSAVEDKFVPKAITLAGSLRRVRTARKLVVLTTLTVSKELRTKLKEVFDLVILLEQDTANGWNLEDYAKIHAFSLEVFSKFVYLSPNALVVKNCDEIFGKYDNFAASYTGQDNDLDTSIFVFAPNTIDKEVLGTFGEGDFRKIFSLWLENNFLGIEKLDDEYNFKLKLHGKVHQGLNSNASIFNFTDVHPLDLSEQVLSKTVKEIGAVEKFAVNQCWNIYSEFAKTSPMNPTQISLKSEYKKEPIAIVGMSFRLPGGNDVDEFWSLLAEGRNAVLPLPSHRWTKEHSHYHGKNRNVEAGFLDFPIDQFDSKFFGLSPKEAEYLDPQQRLLLEVTWEALEDGMIDPVKLRGTQTGVFVGSWLHDYKDMLAVSADPDFFRTYMGNSIATTAARISHFLETMGPSIATESGCSSAIGAVDMACKSLRNGDSSFAIAAGVNLILRPFESTLMEYVLSPDYRCKTFDSEANGFARAEGCGVLLLKRLSDAVKDEDHIWGLIRGTALTQEGMSKSMGTPTIQCESLAMELALKDGAVNPKQVSYVEAHGTGTPVGDPMEIAAIAKAYSKGRSRTEPLLIGSVKTNVGHTESVSGITGIIKVLLSMKNEVIPKHLNLNTLNPNINLETIPARIPLSPVPWPRTEGKRRIAGVSSFGIGGTDGHAIVEEPPKIDNSRLESDLERPLHVMKISAKSTESMEELIEKYLTIFNEKIERNGDSGRDFGDLAYSANVGRATFNHRAVITARNFTEAAKILKEKSFKQSDVQSSGNSLCFLFTGQGSQYPGMAKQLYETSPIFRDSFDICDSILQNRYNISIKATLWNDAGNDELSRTLYSQTSIFLVEYCLLRLWESWGVKPDYVVGHSLGEFAAAVAAGALDMEDALMLVAERSRLIDQLPRGKMLVIKADKKTVDEAISAFQKIKPEFWVDYAALNSQEQTVVAGDSQMIEEFSKFCGGKSLKTIVLAATHAFHSRHMDPMLEAYRKVATTVKKPRMKDDHPKFISGMRGELVDVNFIDAEYWVEHTREKVSYMDACKVITQQENCTLFLEVGPHPVLSALTMMNSEGHPITCLPSIRRNVGEWETMLDSLTKLYLSDWKGEIDWKGFDRFYSRNRVKLPFYPFNRKSVWTRIDPEQAKIHPLIGSIMPTASSETIFQKPLTLKSANYVQDHVIGNTVIFPGAGFLEMCLAGGHATVQGLTEDLMKPRRPILLKSLQIASPLALQESGVSKLQTVITLLNDDEELGYSVGIHRLGDTGNKWIQHATAKFLPMAPSLPKQISQSMDIIEMQTKWEKSDNKDFYDQLPEVGLRFGPQFQSLENGWKNDKGVLASVKVPQDFKDYLVHPIIADAMIQAVMLWTSKDKLKKKLQVPVQIGEFIWLKETESSKQFVYCSSDDNNLPYCLLLDETGTLLAYMKNVDFIETTVKLVEGMISQQSTAMPQLWVDVWKPSRGPMQDFISHNAPLNDLEYNEEDLKHFQEKDNIDSDELNFYRNLIKLTRYSILKALYALGWKPEMSKMFSVESLLESLKIQKNLHQYVRFFLRSMTKEDCRMLRAIDKEESEFVFLVHPPSLHELEAGLKYIASPQDSFRDEYRLIMELSKSLSKIFTGEVDSLTMLFPEDPRKPSAGKFYESCRLQLSILPFTSKIRTHLINAEVKTPKTICRPMYRALEVGAGTGVATKHILAQLVSVAKEDIDIEYYCTDVTAAFFDAAEKALEPNLKSVVFKKYDMEMDPLEQGFCPGYFDLITGTEVFHVAKDIKKTMKSMRSLLKPGGMILLAETVYPDERNTFIFGLLDGYWQFEDRNFRRNHTTLTPEMWREALEEVGFHGITVTPMYNQVHGFISAYADPVENSFLVDLHPRTHSWIIFGDNEDDFTGELSMKLSSVNRKCLVVPRPDSCTETSLEKYFTSAFENAGHIEGIIYLWSLSPNTRDQTKVSLPFLTLTKLISEFKTTPRTFAVVKGVCSIEGSDVPEPTPGTLIGFCKAVANENPNANVTCLDLDPNKETIDQLDELFMNLWVEHKQSSAFRDSLRLCPRLTSAKVLMNEPLSLPSGCDRFQLVLPKTRLISDLEFAYLEPYTIGEDEVEVQVKAMALNFRDVFAVIKPIPLFEKINTVGLDFAGVVVKIGKNVNNVRIGDRVIGMVESDNLSLPSHYKMKDSKVIPLPKSMTFAEGVTLPAVFSTALYCLIKIAKMKKGETVLIHTASGGVGLVAIQLCKYIGANIIATAGSSRKRKYLRNLGIEHVFHSRTTDFKEDILRVTGGRGVDIVLNSLTGPGFKEASLDALGKNGRFIEMSKLNTWAKEEVKVLRPDVFYEIVDLTSLEPQESQSLGNDLRNWIETGCIKPIAYERFDALNIRGALNYLQKAKHIGKIVCMMPEVKLEKSSLIASTPLFNGESTYLVTGGLGGIGFEVVKWMLNNGAVHIAILSRSNPRPDVASQIETWNKNGKHVQAFAVDVGDYDKMKMILEDLKKPELGFPQLRGVMHAAGVLQDAVLENQSWDKFTQTYNPKVKGSWNLHELTKDYLLEHFVLFSSIAATFGSPGQTNHSASNAFEDALASYRISNGLPATCVNWGNWGEVGVATEVDFPGNRPISTAQGLLALETFLKTQTSHMSVLNVDSFSLLSKVFPQVKHYLDDCRLLGDVKTSTIMNFDDFWNEVDSAEDREGKLECFKKFIKTVIRNILKMDGDEPIHDDAELQALGIDSLMMLEMKNGMQNILGGRMALTANQLKDCNTTQVLANKLVSILEGENEEDQKLPSHEELKQLIREDSNLLPESLSVESLKMKPIEKVEKVLLTGVTGNLGPYLLRDLTQRAQVKTVYCLIRPTRNASGMERLKEKLEESKMTGTVNMTKVEVIEGDITSVKLGLNDEAYHNLCEKVDAIVHSAVRSDHTARYWKAPESHKTHMRTVNVLGTARLLEFAALGKLKHFFHASTMLAFTGTGEDGQFTEGWQDVSAFDSSELSVLGYLISKHISEQLVHRALRKGIPCKVFRYPVISGDSITGRANYQQNHALLRWLTCMKIGAIHDIPAPFTAIPVDHCAKISLDIFFNPEAPLDVYNILQKTLAVEQVLVEVADEFGIQMEIVSYEKFLEKLKSEDENSPIANFVKLYVEQETGFISMFETPSSLVLQKYFEDGSSTLHTSKLAKYATKYEELVEDTSVVLKRDLMFLKNEGVFDKYGIQASS